MQEEILGDEGEKIFLENKSLSAGHTFRSEMAQEIISRQPGFLEKWSLLIFLGILMLILGGTWFVHYPDIITARAVLIAENNPNEIVAKQDGKLIKLYVKNNHNVKQGEIIGFFESTANPNEIIQLSKLLDQCISILNTNRLDNIFSLLDKPLTNLGELEQSYQQFLTSKDILKDYTLSSHGTNNMLQQHRQKMLFQQQIQSLKNRVSDWIANYVLQAQSNGKISFINPIEMNQFVRAGNILGYIIPDNSKFYAETVVPQNNVGKIKTGLNVQLRFDAYPYEEWGVVEGTISYISNVSKDNGFLTVIKLNNGLVTNNRNRLDYKSGLHAQAIIITKDMRLLQRFYYGFVKSTSIDK